MKQDYTYIAPGGQPQVVMMIVRRRNNSMMVVRRLTKVRLVMKMMKDSAPVGQLQIPGSVSETEGGKSLLRCNTDVNLSRTLGKVKKYTEVQMQYRHELGQNNSA